MDPNLARGQSWRPARRGGWEGFAPNGHFYKFCLHPRVGPRPGYRPTNNCKGMGVKVSTHTSRPNQAHRRRAGSRGVIMSSGSA